MAYKPRKRTAASESIFFNGIEFRRYPNGKNWSDRNYYRPGGSDILRGIETLHREMWKAAYGPIPEGCDIHHKDNNPLHNELSNLECVPSLDHQRKHGDLTKTEQYRASRAAKLNEIRDKASEWHHSEAGRAWHAEHGKRTWQNRKPVTKVCAYCGKQYETLITRANARFCSDQCKERARSPRKK